MGKKGGLDLNPAGARHSSCPVGLTPLWSCPSQPIPDKVSEPIVGEERGNAQGLGVAAMLQRVRLRYSAVPEEGRLLLEQYPLQSWALTTMRKANDQAELVSDLGAMEISATPGGHRAGQPSAVATSTRNLRR